MTASIGSFKLISESTTDTITSSYIVQPIEKRNKNPSSLWKYYGIAIKENEPTLDGQTNRISKNKNSGDNRFICLLCFQKEKIQLYKKSTSSGNLWRHLNRTHGINVPKCINTAINVRSEIFAPFLEEIDVVHVQPKEDPNNVDAKTDLKFTTHDVINGFKDIGSLLIEEISKHPDLYESNDYNVTEKQEKLWYEIYENLGKVLDIKRLQQMWKNIRDRYIKIRNYEKNKISDVNNFVESSIEYKYYNQMRFLDNELLSEDLENDFDNFSDTISMDEPIDKKPRINDIEEIEIDKDIEEYIIAEVPLPTHNLNETNDDSPLQICIANIDSNINKYNLTASPTSHNYNTTAFSHNEQVQNNNFKIITSNMPCLESVETSFNSTVNLKNVENSENIIIQHDNNSKSDELDLFGRLVAEKMRSIPKSKWDNIQIKVLEILRNE